MIINLKLEYVCRFHEGIDSVVTECRSDLNKKYMPVVNFDPVQCYLRELEVKFDQVNLSYGIIIPFLKFFRLTLVILRYSFITSMVAIL